MTTRLIYSIDTEVSIRNNECDDPDVQIYGRCARGEEYGIRWILDRLSEHGVDATFFLNVYDEHLWSQGTHQRIVDEILDRGSDIQLHTHVENIAWLTERTLDHLTEYSLDWQRRILAHGRERLRAMTGVAPLWHRSGNLAVNADTLQACADTGLTGDSSFAFNWPHSADIGIKDEDRNSLQQTRGVWELPVTTVRTLNGFGPCRHFDINACTFDELKHVTQQAVSAGQPYLVMLMHSFSFIERAERRSQVVPRGRDIRRFERFLEFASQLDDLEIVTFRDVQPATTTPSLPAHDRVDLRTGFLHTYQRAWQNRDRSTKNKLVAYAPVAAAALAALGLCLPRMLSGSHGADAPSPQQASTSWAS